jgi:hypothetical protein
MCWPVCLARGVLLQLFVQTYHRLLSAFGTSITNAYSTHFVKSSGLNAIAKFHYRPPCPVRMVGQTRLLHLCSICRVGQEHIYTVYIRYFWQKHHQIHGHIRCIYTILANPKRLCFVLSYFAGLLQSGLLLFRAYNQL